DTLSATSGAWTPTPDSYAYQWQVASSAIGPWSSATGTGNASSSYTVAATDLAKYLRVQVTASKTAYGDDTQPSSATSPVAAGTFVSNSVPTISGTAVVGGTLTDGPGTWTPTPDSHSFQWQVSANGIDTWTNATGGGATTETYSIVA